MDEGIGDDQAIALTEISWEKSMRNEQNPRTHEEVIRTETSIRTVDMGTGRKTTQQSNPLFSSFGGGEDEGVGGVGNSEASAELQFASEANQGGGVQRSPANLNPIYLEDDDGDGNEDVVSGEKKVHFNALAEGAADAPSHGDEEGDASSAFSMRTKARSVVYSIKFQSFIIFLLLLDLALLITEVLIDRGDTSDKHKLRAHRAVDICTALIIFTLTFEIALRIVADTPNVFFKKKMNIFDLLVVLGSLVLLMLDLEYTGALLAGRSIRMASHLRLIQKARLAAHSLRVVARSLGSSKRAQVAARHKVGSNKKRYQRHGFDLDLCYITPHIIAMSVPAVDNIVKLYRNPIEEVERFFRKMHTELHPAGQGQLEGLYQIHNMCPELPYADSYFHISGGEIVRYGVQDHTPPSMDQLVDFCYNAQEFLSRKGKGKKKAVIAIHCRGGKGRTGTACVAWLLYSKQFKTSEDAMDFFAKKRTDLTKKGKLQGIETPSQRRYVKFFERFINDNWYWKNAKKQLPPLGSLRYTPEVYVDLKALRAPICLDLQAMEAKEKASSSADVFTPRAVYAVIDTKDQDFFKVTTEVPVSPDGSFTIGLTDDGGCRLKGDARVRVFALPSGKRAPTINEVTHKLMVTKAGKEQGLLFFFWFHTAFVGETLGEPLTLHLPDLDKAWKNKKGFFHVGTTVHLDLDRVS